MVPPPFPWKGLFYDLWAERYTKKEVALRSFNRRADLIGFPLTIACYLALGSSLAPSGEIQVVMPPSNIFGMLAASTLLALVIIYQHCFCLPTAAEAEVEKFAAGLMVGRWIYLTRQTLALQAVHLGCSVLALTHDLPWLQGITHAMATPSAGLAIFVTIQFFTLVAPNKDFHVECALWKQRATPYWELQIMDHVPCGVLGLLDVCVLKERSLALAALPATTTLLLVFFTYVLLYIALLHVNQRATGHWPYSICKPLGHSVRKWGSFAVVQSAILCLFLAVAVLAVRVCPRAW